MCDRRPRPMISTTARVVIVDDPSKAITIAGYGENRQMITVPISPSRALGLAQELVAAAQRRLG